MATFGKREAAPSTVDTYVVPFWQRDIHPILFVPLFILAPIAGAIFAAMVFK